MSLSIPYRILTAALTALSAISLEIFQFPTGFSHAVVSVIIHLKHNFQFPTGFSR